MCVCVRTHVYVCVCVCVWREREKPISFKELAHAMVGTDESETFRAVQQLKMLNFPDSLAAGVACVGDLANEI